MARNPSHRAKRLKRPPDKVNVVSTSLLGKPAGKGSLRHVDPKLLRAISAIVDAELKLKHTLPEASGRVSLLKDGKSSSVRLLKDGKVEISDAGGRSSVIQLLGREPSLTVHVGQIDKTIKPARTREWVAFHSKKGLLARDPEFSSLITAVRDLGYDPGSKDVVFKVRGGRILLS